MPMTSAARTHAPIVRHGGRAEACPRRSRKLDITAPCWRSALQERAGEYVSPPTASHPTGSGTLCQLDRSCLVSHCATEGGIHGPLRSMPVPSDLVSETAGATLGL